MRTGPVALLADVDIGRRVRLANSHRDGDLAEGVFQVDHHDAFGSMVLRPVVNGRAARRRIVVMPSRALCRVIDERSYNGYD